MTDQTNTLFLYLMILFGLANIFTSTVVLVGFGLINHRIDSCVSGMAGIGVGLILIRIAGKDLKK